MASWPGPRLEDFLDDLYFAPVDAATLARWEPHRSEIEHALADYDAETQSWRDYRNALASLYPDALDPA